MSDYRRLYIPGGVYFFTLVTWHRQPFFKNVEHVAVLSEAIRHVKRQRPFAMDAIIVLPDHLHTIWRLPENDADYSGRWREIKKRVSRSIAPSSDQSGESKVWQRRFWEHHIVDEADWRIHMDYIHYNPVKHGLAVSPCDWPYSSFLNCVKRGWYDMNWGQSDLSHIEQLNFE